MRQHPFFRGFERLDLVLALAALVSLVLFFWAAPSQYPHSAAAEHVPSEEAKRAAADFVRARSGLDLEISEAAAAVVSSSSLIDSLQRYHGRREAIERLRAGEFPGYFWDVEWREEGQENQGSSSARRAQVRLTLDGRPIEMEVTGSTSELPPVHAGALALALDLDVDVDTLRTRRFGFNLDSENGVARLEKQLALGDRITWGYPEAVRIAEHHLRTTALGSAEIRADSVYLSGTNGIVTATVRFASADTVIGRRFTADVEVLPSGGLERIDVQYVREPEMEELTTEALADLLAPGIFALIALILIAVFFRRLNAKLIDTKTALKDGLVLGLAAGLATFGQVTDAGDVNTAVEFAVVIVGFVIVTALAAVLMFMLVGTVTSLARDVWSDKLSSMDLLRTAVIRNVPVGVALVRGTWVALILCGLLTLVLILLPGVWIETSEVSFYKVTPGLNVLQDIGGYLFASSWCTFVATVAIAVFLQQRVRRATAVVAGVALALALMQLSPGTLRPYGAEFASSALIGLVIGWSFWRFDLLTTFAAFLVFELVGGSFVGLMVPASPEFWEALIFLAVAGAIFVLGLVGVASGKTSTDVPAIVPEYVRELARQARLTREFELAREVQLSFLPSENPKVDGLDIASICLPANEVGGDYYDFFRVDDRRLALVVGDVSGKGMQAAFYMTLMKGILQSMVKDGERPASIVERANEVFRMNAPRGMFMSMVFGMIDVDTRTFTYVRAGHNPILVHRADAERPEEIKPRGAAIGLAPGAKFSEQLEEVTVRLQPGDVILVYTDGVTEAMNERRELYEECRLEEAVVAARRSDAESVLKCIVDDVAAFAGTASRHDDMTMVAVRVTT